MLGAILMFGVFVTTLVMIQLQFVPVWDHQREARLAETMLQEMAYLKTDLDRQVGNQTSTAISDPFTLGSREGWAFFQGPSTPGIMSFSPVGQGTGFAASSNRLTLQSLNGVSQQGLQTYEAFSGGVAATGVSNLVALQLRLNNPMGAGTAAVAPFEATMRLDASDSANRCVGQFFMRISGPAGGPRSVQLNTYPGQASNCTASFPATPAYTKDTTLGCTDCISPSYYFVDVLEPQVAFGALLAAGTPPYTLTFTLTGSPGPSMSRILAYDQATQGGSVRVGGGGYIVNNYTSTVSSGALVLDKPNHRFPAQTLTLEYGAVILTQSTGSVMVLPPSFSVTSTATQARLEWTVPALTGSANEIGGVSQATVTSTPVGGRSSLDALAPMVAFNLTTNHGDVWTSFWNSTLVRAGFTNGLHFQASSNATSAAVVFYGPVSAPADLTMDLLLRVAVAPLSVVVSAA